MEEGWGGEGGAGGAGQEHGGPSAPGDLSRSRPAKAKGTGDGGGGRGGRRSGPLESHTGTCVRRCLTCTRINAGSLVRRREKVKVILDWIRFVLCKTVAQVRAAACSIPGHEFKVKL